MQQQQRLRRQLSMSQQQQQQRPARWILVTLLVAAISVLTASAFTTAPFGRLMSRSCLPRTFSASSSNGSSGTSRTAESTATGNTNSMAEDSNSSDDSLPQPRTFREAEILGLKRMQQGNYQEALKVFKKGLNLPGSRPDVVRTKSLSGPSPVGGSMGGFDSNNRRLLDEFELQAAYYNMACAHAQLQQCAESVAALKSAFDNGFDNYATVRGDDDLDPIKNSPEFEALMEKNDPKKGFNPFGLFGGK